MTRRLFKTRLLLGTLLVLLAGVLTIYFSPFLVGNGVRLWIWWKAGQQNFTVKIDQIEAPFLRPVTLRGVHITNPSDAAFRIELRAEGAAATLNLKSVLLRTRGRTLKNLSVAGLRMEIHQNPSGKTFPEHSWKTWQKLLPAGLELNQFDLRIEDGSSIILLRNGSLTASDIEAGRFRAGELMITSPWLRQTYYDLRGATNWQADRLTIAGLSLTRGLDVQSITADLSRLRKQRIGVAFDLDAFGGKIRATISNEWRSRHSNWNIAGSAAGVSLAQTSTAIGFADRIDGTLHACNFTFRGDLRDTTHATASLWTELTGLTWRDRKADVLMLGVSFYNQQIDLQQLYVKQGRNQLTLNGEASFPNASQWLSPDFRGNISASITNLGDFAALFGANRGDFAGAIAIEGTMNARDRKIGGSLTAAGSSLTVFKTSIDALTANVNLKGTELEIEDLELKRRKDFLQANGKIDLAHDHNYSGTLSVTIANVAEYLATFGGPAPSEAKPTAAEIQSTIESGVWDVRGTIKIPESKPLDFSATFPLQIGKDWNAFLASHISVIVDFPAIQVANAPRLFSREVVREGLLIGKLTLSETLQHPRIDGEAQITDGKLQNAVVNLTDMSGHVTFNGERASIDLLNLAGKDVRLACNGEIDFRDSNDLAIRLIGTEPIVDLTSRPFDCVSQIEVALARAATVPIVAELEFRGGLFRSDWTVSLKEPGKDPLTGPASETARKFPLCFGTNTDDKRLTLGVRPPAKSEKVRLRKRGRR